MPRKASQLLLIPALVALAACGSGGEANAPDATASASAEPQGGADAMASNDPAAGQAAQHPDAAQIPDAEERPIMQAQVVLDRQGFSPGVIDGAMGQSTKAALRGFQRARGLTESGELDDATSQAMSEWSNIAATRVVTIPESFAVGRFEALPDDPAEQAKRERLGYESLDEKLAERFHTTIETLEMLNPGGRPATLGSATLTAASTTPASGTPTGTTGRAPAPARSTTASPSAQANATGTPAATPATTSSSPSPGTTSGQAGTATPGPQSRFAAGQQIRVPNIGADRIDASADLDNRWRMTLRDLGVGTGQPKATRIVADKSDSVLMVYDEADKLVAQFSITSGSSNDPLPLGDWKVLGVAHNPTFAFNPELFWDVPDSTEKQQLPPGPNGPVGVVWIDLSKEHYGIHGTPEPQTIGRAQSHGCVRLTNWDAARLAQMVSPGTEVEFRA